MLTVVDNLARALEHLPAEARASADPAIRSMIDGVELTARDLEAVLGRHGVKKLDPKGQKFDPNLPPGDFRGARRDGSRRHGLPGRPDRLDDRRSRAAPGDGRRLQGRAEGRAQARAGVERKIADQAAGWSRSSMVCPITAAFRPCLAAPKSSSPGRSSTAQSGCSEARHPPKRQVDPAALGQEGRGTGENAVDAVEGEAALARQAPWRRRRRGGRSGSARCAQARRRGRARCRRATARRRGRRSPPRRGPGAGPCARSAS